MKTWIDFDSAPVFAIPLTDEVDGRRACEGMLIEGPQGWGEFTPPAGATPAQAGRWLTAAIEVGTVGWPDPMRGRVPVAATVPPVSADRARQLVAGAGCSTATVHVGGALVDDVARVEAVREALGPGGAIRCDAAGRWDVDTAVAAINALDSAAGGVEFSLGGARLLAGDLVSDARSLIPDDGFLPVAPMPSGPDRDRVHRYAPADDATVARWRSRLASAQAFI